MDRFATAIRSGERRWEAFREHTRPLFEKIRLEYKEQKKTRPIVDTPGWIDMNFSGFLYSAARKAITCEELFITYEADTVKNILDFQSTIIIRMNHDLIRMAIIDLSNFRDATKFYFKNSNHIIRLVDEFFPNLKESRHAIAHAAERKIAFAIPPKIINKNPIPLDFEPDALFTKIAGTEFEFMFHDGSKKCIDLSSGRFEQFIRKASS